MNTASSNIKVFPAARRIGEADPFSRLMSESTIASIVNRLVDSEGFVITSNTGTISSGVFEFNIFGYYIRIANISSILSSLSSGTSIYATIFLQNFTNDGVTYTELVGTDSETSSPTYSGVEFTTSIPSDRTDQEKHSLKILEKVSGSWKVPSESRMKFSSDSLDIDVIDGGLI